ncbi:MAG: Gfo/Idh/MocA family oxidoreductase [Candidatus Bathyarchaeia archaeon]
MNVGLIGCGRISHVHMKAYKAIDKIRVVAVSDVDVNKAKAFANLYKIEKVCSDYREFLDIKDLDFVDICTPTGTHETIVCEAARGGVNVLVEKPMGRNSKECEEMITEARKHGTQICVCHNQLFYPSVRLLKSIADSKDFNLIAFRTFHRENFEWLKTHGLAQPWNVDPEHGGILWEVGTHLAYLQLNFLNDVSEVYALGAKAKYRVWDDFMVLLRTPSQRWGIMEISWVAKESEMFYEIVSSDGRRVQAFIPHNYVIERAQESAADVTGVARNFLTDLKRLYRKWAKFTVDQFKKPLSGHFELITGYVNSLEKGLPAPITGEDGRNAVKLLECIQESLDMQRPTNINLWKSSLS